MNDTANPSGPSRPFLSRLPDSRALLAAVHIEPYTIKLLCCHLSYLGPQDMDPRGGCTRKCLYKPRMLKLEYRLVPRGFGDAPVQTAVIEDYHPSASSLNEFGQTCYQVNGVDTQVLQDTFL